MKPIFMETRMLREAKQAQRGNFFMAEIAIFFLLYGISSLLQSFLILPAQIIHFKNSMDVALLSRAVYSAEDLILAVKHILEILFLSVTPSFIYLTNLFATVATIIVCCIFSRKFQHRTNTALGFTKKHALPEYLLGYVLGAVMIAAVWGICLATGTARLNGISSTFSLTWFLLFFAGFLVQGMSEEVLLRSFLLVSLSRRYQFIWCILINSFLFALLHIFNPGITPLALLNLFLAGVLFSVYFLKRGSIWGVAAMHSAWNFIQGNLFGVEVSGMNMGSSLLQTTVDAEFAWLNGGSFGLEGGLAVTIVQLVFIVLFLLMPTKRSELS